MARSIVSTPNAPAAIGTYSQAVRAGDTVYLSGQIGLDPQTMTLVDGIDAQIERVFLNLEMQGVGPDEAGVDEYVRRAKSRDSDLWIVEIEDKEGRTFLTEPVEN